MTKVYEGLSRLRRFTLLVGLVGTHACIGSDATPELSTQPAVTLPRAGRSGGTTSVSVTSVSPDSGALSTTIDVDVNGNGFSDGMVATWEQQGLPDSTQIKTNSTRFVSSKQLVANITISGTATSGTWDVAVFAKGKTGVGSEAAILKNGFKVTDPTATWYFPLADENLNVKSDRLFGDGVSSVYANGVCKVSTTMFATSVTSSSGDVVLNTGTGGNCRRHFTVAYPDGLTESVPAFFNLQKIEKPTLAIPVGQTVRRRFMFNMTSVNGNPGRCGNLRFGPNGAVDAGSDSVMVTRVDASTWHVESQPAPSDLAHCVDTGQLIHLQLKFTIVSSRPMP